MDKIKLISALIVSFIAQVVGGWDVMLQTWCVLAVLDIITGVICGISKKELSSSIARHGFLKKVGSLIIVAVAVQLDRLFGTDTLRGAAIGFFIGVEGLSIIENWGGFGLPLPEKLKDVLKELR